MGYGSHGGSSSLIFPLSARGLVPTTRVHSARSGFFARCSGGNSALVAAFAATRNAVLVCCVAASVFLSGCAPAFAHDHLESWYADVLAAETGARTEVRMRDGTRCDVLTSTHAVEVEFAPKWCEAVGQSLNYASQTGKPGAIALILERGSDARFLQRLRNLIAWHHLPLSVVVLRPLNRDGVEFENLNAVVTQRRGGAEKK